MIVPELQNIRKGCLVLVRHGETAWNREEVFRGRADVPLNETGRIQARAVSRSLADEPVDAVYSSPLVRAIETAEAIAAPHGLAVAPHEELTDFDCGDWQGHTLDEVRTGYPDLFRAWADRPHTVRFPHGETLDEVRSRAVHGIETVLSQGTGGRTTVVVAHRVVNKVLLCAMLGLDNSRFWNIFQSTACINRIVFGRYGPEIHGLNDVGHLRDAGTEPIDADF